MNFIFAVHLPLSHQLLHQICFPERHIVHAILRNKLVYVHQSHHILSNIYSALTVPNNPSVLALECNLLRDTIVHLGLL